MVPARRSSPDAVVLCISKDIKECRVEECRAIAIVACALGDPKSRDARCDHAAWNIVLQVRDVVAGAACIHAAFTLSSLTLVCARSNMNAPEAGPTWLRAFVPACRKDNG
jgi:hypothetical protein